MGGGTTRAYNIAKGLAVNGCSVTVISAFPHYPEGKIPEEYRWVPLKIENMNGIRVIRTIVPPLPSRGLVSRLIPFTSFIISSLFALPVIRKADIIWAANPNVLSFIPGMIYSKIFRSSLTLNMDDPWPEDLYNFNLVKKSSIIFKIGTLLARIAYHKAKLITPISPGYLKILVDRYKVDKKKIKIIRAGVDLEIFNVKNEKSNGKEFRILYSGSFSVAYDFDQVIEAAKILKNYRNIKIILQGGGELLEYIKNRVVREKLDNIVIIDKILSREKVAELLNKSDVLLLPLRNFGKPYLGISSKLYEYQSIGRPIICCADGQPAEYVEKTDSGIVVKPGDFKALANAIFYLKENRDVAERLGASGRYYVENNLTIERIGKDIVNIFINMIFQKGKAKNI